MGEWLIMKRRRFLFFCAALLVIINSLVNVYFAVLIQKIIDLAISKNKEMFTNIVILSVSYILFISAINILTSYFKEKYLRNKTAYVRNSLILGTLKKDRHSGSIQDNEISTVINNINMYRDEYLNSIFDILDYIPSFILAVILLTRISVIILIVITIVSLVPIYITNSQAKIINDKQNEYTGSLSQLTNKVKEAFLGLNIIKSFGAEYNVYKNIESYVFRVEDKKFNYNFTSEIINTLSNFFGNAIFVITFCVGAYLSIKGEISVGMLVSAIQLMNYIVNPVLNTSARINKINSFKTINKYIQENSSFVEENELQINKKNYDEVASFQNDIVLKNINYGYDSDKLIIKNLSYTFKKGKKYAIVGLSGSGKTTLLKLIMGQLSPTSGSIYYDGIDSSIVQEEYIFKNMTLVHQDVFLFDDSIKNNITFFNYYNTIKINEAIQKAALSNLVDSLPLGMDEQIGENGAYFSGGEKQRLTIARAIIRESPIILMDESTASLDIKTALNIEKTLLEMEDILYIAVTHKLNKNILSKYDEILVLNNGELIESGKFEELMKNDTYFKGFYQIQE